MDAAFFGSLSNEGNEMDSAQTVSGTNSTSTGATVVLVLVLVLVLALVLEELVLALVLALVLVLVLSGGGLCNEATHAVRSCKQGSVRKDPAPVRG